MQERIIHLDTQITAESPNAARIHRSSLMSSIVEHLEQLPKKPDAIMPPAPFNRHERRKMEAQRRRAGTTQPGTYVTNPEGRRFKIHLTGGIDHQGHAVVGLLRVDRRAREQRIVWRPASEVEGWAKETFEA